MSKLLFSCTVSAICSQPRDVRTNFLDRWRNHGKHTALNHNQRTTPPNVRRKSTSSVPVVTLCIFPALLGAEETFLNTQNVSVHGRHATEDMSYTEQHPSNGRQVYKGKDEILLSELILNPSHSILTQSFDSRLRLVRVPPISYLPIPAP